MKNDFVWEYNSPCVANGARKAYVYRYSDAAEAILSDVPRLIAILCWIVFLGMIHDTHLDSIASSRWVKYKSHFHDFTKHLR